MVSREKLYEAFGELIYAVAMADGEVQDEEIAILESTLKNHSWAADIQWSFKYEQKKFHSVEHSYQKAMDIFKENGPDKEYGFFVEVLKLVAEAHHGAAEDSERQLIDSFVKDLTEQFRNDLDIIGYE